MSTPLQSSISKIRCEINDQLDALENLATSKAKALETAEQRYLELERERDGLNRDQTELAARVDELKAQLANHATVPRIITFEELERAAMTMRHQQVDTLWVESPSEKDADIKVMRRSLEAIGVHLEDAPAEEPEPVKVGDTLTAEQLAGVEVEPGTILRGSASVPWYFFDDGYWYSVCDEEGHAPATMSHHAPFTVLHLPEETA